MILILILKNFVSRINEPLILNLIVLRPYFEFYIPNPDSIIMIRIMINKKYNYYPNL